MCPGEGGTGRAISQCGNQCRPGQPSAAQAGNDCRSGTPYSPDGNCGTSHNSGVVNVDRRKHRPESRTDRFTSTGAPFGSYHECTCQQRHSIQRPVWQSSPTTGGHRNEMRRLSGSRNWSNPSPVAACQRLCTSIRSSIAPAMEFSWSALIGCSAAVTDSILARPICRPARSVTSVMLRRRTFSAIAGAASHLPASDPFRVDVATVKLQ